jgi:urea transporter/murein DD-endopeptidase MepM/ murein hydrolase activator NlpD
MISIPDRDEVAASTLAEALWHGVPRAYAIFFFSANQRLGWLLLGVSLLTPGIGWLGLGGAIAAGVIAWGLGFDRDKVRNGYLLFNPLLVCLTLGLMNRSYFFPPSALAVFWVAAVLGALFITVTLQHVVGQHLGLSAQSLPAVACAYALYFVAFALSGPATIPVEASNGWLDLPFLPATAQTFFQVFGAMVFEPHALAGVLIFLALALTSPISTMVATAAYFTGLGTLGLLGFHANHDSSTWCGFNFLLCGIALGSAYFAPSRLSLLLALTGTFLCALVTLALVTALRYFGLPPSALPYNLVVLVLVYALRQRHTHAGLHPSPSHGMSPETASRFVVLNAARFPHLPLPALDLPFKDKCIVTQGVDGALTHRGAWRWALDFEVLDHDRAAATAAHSLESFSSFNRMVLAPCAGTVAVVRGDVRDNRPGENNPADNWGNYVVLHGDAGYYVLLAHLRRDSILVHAGQRVVSGTPLGRCGNSGRSPVPHLHLQIQDTAVPGAPTRPFCLRHVLESRAHGSAPHYFTSSIPAEGACLASTTPLPALHALFCNWLPRDYRYRIFHDDEAVGEETLQLSFDPAGRFRLRSRKYAAQLTAFVTQNVFYAIDYDGPGDSLLALIATGLARVPCLADPGLTWNDHASPAPFGGGLARKVHDLLDPYLGPNLLSYRYCLQTDENGFEVRCTLQPDQGISSVAPLRPPHFIATRLASRSGIQRLTARLGNEVELRAELITPRPEFHRMDILPRALSPTLEANYP